MLTVSKRILTIAAALTLGMAGLTFAQAKPVTAAVVDVQKVFNELDEKNSVEADITQQAEKLQKEEQDKQTELKALDADLRILAPDSDAYKQTRNKLEMKAIEFQAWKQFQQRKLESEKAIRIEALYLKVIDSIERVAKKEGFDLVLFKDQTESLRGQNAQQLATLIQVRKVLYSNPSLDITDQIKTMCNNEYNTRKGAAGKAAPAPAKK